MEVEKKISEKEEKINNKIKEIQDEFVKILKLDKNEKKK
jgi:hypothetical protein